MNHTWRSGALDAGCVDEGGDHVVGFGGVDLDPPDPVGDQRPLDVRSRTQGRESGPVEDAVGLVVGGAVLALGGTVLAVEHHQHRGRLATDGDAQQGEEPELGGQVAGQVAGEDRGGETERRTPEQVVTVTRSRGTPAGITTPPLGMSSATVVGR